MNSTFHLPGTAIFISRHPAKVAMVKKTYITVDVPAVLLKAQETLETRSILFIRNMIHSSALTRLRSCLHHQAEKIVLERAISTGL